MTLNLQHLIFSDSEFRQKLKVQLKQTVDIDDDLTNIVSEILKGVRQRGDEALKDYTRRFDRREVDIFNLEVSNETIHCALEKIPGGIKDELERAAMRIRSYHEHQRLDSWSYHDEDGTLLGQKVTALDSVGVYVPGGKAAYPSSVLMNTIPARVAGVAKITMVVPAPDGDINPLVLAAAAIAGVDRVFSVGGAQAIAALAYGTATIPAVDKIVGPGNRFVAEAKRQVFGIVGVDMIAGPSEVLIVCDGSSDADWVAMDMFAQAEHDEDARAILISTDAKFSDAVEESMNRLLPEMERKDIIGKSIAKNGLVISVENLTEAAELVNQIAPEHLELAIDEPEKMLELIRHAGAIFMGHCTAEVFGDYCAGPNHVLPTAGTARFSSPLGVYDFQKRSSLIMCSESSASDLAITASVLARGEGLTAHARSAELRKKD